MVINQLKSLLRKIKRVYLIIALIIAVIAVFAVSVTAQIKNITITADGKTYTVKSYARTVESVLEQNDIQVGENDEIQPPLDEYTSKNMTITVKRAFDVPFVLGTDSFVLKSVTQPLSSLLEKEGIKVYENDLVDPPLDTVIEEGMSVNITRIFKGDISETEVIPYTKKFVANASLVRGETKVRTKGEDGEKESVYTVTVTNGEETERVLKDERITKEPVKEIIEFGTKYVSGSAKNGVVSNATETFAGVSYIDCKAYSYILTGKTASGMITQPGVVAVDPRVIPLGTRLYIQSLDGKPDYGYAIAADTGGAIKGNIIDLWVSSYAEACANGVRRMRVYILS
ncbi:MAG: DUF348 domain-containing protein [Clostridia bacterium]|nr:DUF348 domain-containing protein [Clostridia bacterium]